MLTVKFKFERTTKGAVRFNEVDDTGMPIGHDQLKVGALYLRKTAFPDGQIPQALTVRIDGAAQ